MFTNKKFKQIFTLDFGACVKYQYNDKQQNACKTINILFVNTIHLNACLNVLC